MLQTSRPFLWGKILFESFYKCALLPPCAIRRSAGAHQIGLFFPHYGLVFFIQ